MQHTLDARGSAATLRKTFPSKFFPFSRLLEGNPGSAQDAWHGGCPLFAAYNRRYNANNRQKGGVARAAPPEFKPAPPNSMASVQKNPDERDLRYLQLVTGRLEGRSEDKIAARIGFDSPVALYRQLAHDGFPLCAECGASYVKEGHCEKPTSKRKRQAKSGAGEPKELPPPANAMDMFRRVVEELDRSVSYLSPRKEYYQDERFVGEDAYSNASASFTRRGLPSGEEGDELWEKICKEYDQDPSIQSFHILNAPITVPAGAPQTPPEPLTILIAVYALAGEPIDPLLEVLHPESEKAEIERINEKIRNLRLYAGQVAKLVRGGILRQGPSTGELSVREQNVAWYIREQREAGVPEEEIHRALSRLGVEPSDISRLGNFRLPPPQS